MPYLISAGKVTQNNVPTPMYILARLNLDAQAISVAKEYADLKLGVTASPLKAALEKKKASGKSVKAAMTFPGGTHDLWIRYWLAAGGIDPDKDIETIVVPPPQDGGEHEGRHHGLLLRRRAMEPGQLIHQGIGYTALNTGELWSKHPEKSLGMRAAWVDKYPNAAKAILMAVMEAQQWADKAENKAELAAIMGKRQWMNCPVEDILDRSQRQVRLRHWPRGREQPAHHEVLARLRLLSVPEPRSVVPHRGYPLGQIRARLRHQGPHCQKVNREDLWRDAAKTLGVAAADIPASNSRGKETFFDGKIFDPENPVAYLKSLRRSSVRR